MGQLHQMKLAIEEQIKARKLDASEVRGKLGLRSGILLALIKENSPDNPQSIHRLKLAAQEVLSLSL